MRNLRLGTRQSPLALWQAGHVRQLLLQHSEIDDVELVPIVSTGDQVEGPLHLHGGKGLFVKELDEALLRGTIDCAVHSVKDIPGILPDGISLAAIAERGLVHDVALLREGTLTDLPAGARVGTCSPRRRLQLQARWSQLEVADMRGNVGSRLQKLASGEYDAIILAAAGLERLGMLPIDAQSLSFDEMLPAIGQGAIGVTACTAEVEIGALLHACCTHEQTDRCVRVERSVLRAIEGDCHTPLAALAECTGEELRLRAFYASSDGARAVRHEMCGDASTGEDLGKSMATHLLDAIAE